jgi:hypothetical protein
MELLLNLFWLTLALPAAWLLKNKAVPAPKSLKIARLRPFLLMACVLTLLFPVVSASDDLHAMRPEIEESGAGKRVGRQAPAARPAAGRCGIGPCLVQAPFPVLLYPGDEVCGLVSTIEFLLPDPAQLSPRSSRGPPSVDLA